MIYIAHRGNTTGPQPLNENDPRYLETALYEGFHIEIDVWYLNGNFLLGHDVPIHFVKAAFLIREGIWCHAKNIEALARLLGMGAHCFWHENDAYTLTSRGMIWTFPGKTLGSHRAVANAVLVMPELCNMIGPDFSLRTSQINAICSDYVRNIKERTQLNEDCNMPFRTSQDV
jgi:hypothetical protein